MGNKTNISWTGENGKTWNPWMGCHKVSAGCKNCYMFRDMKHYGKDPSVVRKSKTTFCAPLGWHEPAKVFACSWSDFFIEEADEWRDEAWSIIKATPHLTYQILTKRPERIAEYLPADWGEGYRNVWLGVTTENQETANARIPILLGVPAFIRWLSVEPMLGPVDLYHIPITDSNGITMNVLARASVFAPHINWVVCGGESGSDYRSMSLDDARGLRDQCVATDTAFFFKQQSGTKPGTNPTLDGQEWHQFPGEYDATRE